MRVEENIATRAARFISRFERGVSNRLSHDYFDRINSFKAGMEYRRKKPLKLSVGMNLDVFSAIAHHATKGKPRVISVDVGCAAVTCRMRSRTGRSVSSFALDFYDYGEITGRFWVWSDNSESALPHTIGQEIKNDIEACLRGEQPHYIELALEELVAAKAQQQNQYREYKHSARKVTRRRHLSRRKKKKLIRTLAVSAFILWLLVLFVLVGFSQL